MQDTKLHVGCRSVRTQLAIWLICIGSMSLPTTAVGQVCLGDADNDTDGVIDCLDNCPALANDQSDTDADGIGDACDCDLTIDVTRDGDDGECAIDCTLREAIGLAPSGCAIRVPAGNYTKTLGAISIGRSVTLIGDGADVTGFQGVNQTGTAFNIHVDEPSDGDNRVYISGLTVDQHFRAFDVLNDKPMALELWLSNLVLRDNAGGGLKAGNVNCCYAFKVTIDHSSIVDNGPGDPLNAGGISLEGSHLQSNSLYLNDTLIADNGRNGLKIGGADSLGPMNGRGLAYLERCTVSGNDTEVQGGGILVAGGSGAGALGGFLSIVDSTVSGNSAGLEGGGIFAGAGFQGGGPATVVIGNSTISSNGSSSGGGIYAAGSVSLSSATLAGNSVNGSGGGIALGPTGSVEIQNVALSGNAAGVGGPDCSGLLESNGHNLIGESAGCTIVGDPTGNQSNVDALLGPLQFNGGPTLTHAPLDGSPLIDAGSACPNHDQRGVARPQGMQCDIGSVEDALDTDGDGVPDDLDGCPAVPDKYEPGQCGCDFPDDDSDGDGVADCIDACPETPGQVSSGSCDCGLDPDGDDVCSGDDNCPGVPNPDQSDVDADGWGADCDCDDLDASTYVGAEEINDGQDNQCPGDAGYGVADEISGNSGFLHAGDTVTYSWPAQPGATSYFVARATSSDFTAGCESTVALDTSHIDSQVPSPSVVFYYLNRPRSPWTGSWGQRSNGDERVFTCASE